MLPMLENRFRRIQPTIPESFTGGGMAAAISVRTKHHFLKIPHRAPRAHFFLYSLSCARDPQIARGAKILSITRFFFYKKPHFGDETLSFLAKFPFQSLKFLKWFLNFSRKLGV